jgi:hypothetical protein
MTAVRTPLIGLALFLLTGCVIQRAQTAANAQTGMVGMSKEQVLACMGVPNASMAEGNTEVWSYSSGNGRSDTFTTANSSTVGSGQVLGSATRIGPTTYFGANATGASNTNAVGFATTRQRSCTINVVMSGGQVSRVNYSGPTGGVVTPGEQCAYAVQNCVR